MPAQSVLAYSHNQMLENVVFFTIKINFWNNS